MARSLSCAPSASKRQRVTTEEKLHICDQCNYSTSRPADFKRHKVVHLDPELKRKFKCPYADEGCSFATAQKSNVGIHVNARHEKKRKYVCEFFSKCGKNYTNPSSLNRHLRDAHGRTRRNRRAREASASLEGLAPSTPLAAAAGESSLPLADVEDSLDEVDSRLLSTEKPLPPLPPLPPIPFLPSLPPLPSYPSSPPLPPLPPLPSLIPGPPTPFSQGRTSYFMREWTGSGVSQAGPSRHIRSPAFDTGREVHERIASANFRLTPVDDERFTSGPHLAPPLLRQPLPNGDEVRGETLPSIRDVFADFPWPDTWGHV